MSILTNRRRGVGKSLPYDAEIEYLESTGTQYIDTGVNCREIVRAVYSFSFSSVPTSIDALIGAFWNYTPSIPRFQFYYNNGWKDVNATYSKTTGSGIANNGIAKANTIYTVTTESKIKYATDSTIWVFARNSDNNTALNVHNLRLYYLSMYWGGVLIRDFIPVRKGNVGYLYDKVSGQLFGNSGTGNFILGADK